MSLPLYPILFRSLNCQRKEKKNNKSVNTTAFLSRFIVQAKDNPNSTNNSNVVEAPVIVNLVGPDNFLILTIENASPESLQKDRSKIARIIEDKTGLLIEIEKIDSRRSLSVNNTIEVQHHDSDVWFYAIDNESEKILLRNSSLLHR